MSQNVKTSPQSFTSFPNLARLLRLSTVQHALERGIITRPQALELLQGAVIRGDTSLIVDDSSLLDSDWDTIRNVIN